MGKNKNKKYTEEQIEFVKNLVEKGESVTRSTMMMCLEFNLDYNENIGRRFRKIMQNRGVTNNVVKIEETDVFKEAQQKEHDATKKRFLISWAQAETPVHKKFLKNIEAYAEHIDAEILIIAGRYKNPNSLEASEAIKNKEKNKKNSWDNLVLPYLDANRHNLHKYLQVLSDVKIQPTASTPLSGMNSISGLESCIIGHPRVQLQSLPVSDGYPHKLLLTTGACTLPNYTDTKVGKKSEFHHQTAFVIVELDGNDFHVRQVVADKKGDFYDLIYQIKGGEVLSCCSSIPAIVFGDIHYNHHNEKALNTSLELARKLNAEKVVLHDLCDSGSISHHELKDPFQLLKREEDGSWNLRTELDSIVDWLNFNNDLKFFVVRSNHDDFIDRWLANSDWRKSTNKKLYLELANLVAQGEITKGVLPYVLEKETKNAYGLALDESLNVLGFELGSHGHVGVHGARASAIQLKSLPMKTVTGHRHSPERIDGHLCVGTLTELRVGYNRGFSGWLHSNVVIYPNGKASHINIINGKFTTLI